MKPFRERNPVVVGAVSIAVLIGLFLAAFRAQDLPLIGGGDTVYADFSEAGGLKADDPVRVAGVRVGKVDSVELDGDHVRATLRLDTDTRLGDQTRADIKVATLLGSMYVSLDPAGQGSLDDGSSIPMARTSSPFDVVDAFSGLADTASRIDTDQLAKSLSTLADLTRNTPEEFRSALKGVSALSSNIAAKNDQINSLLKSLNKVSTTLDARDQDVIGLMRDADVLFRALVARREAVHQLLVSTSTVSQQLTGLVRDTRADLKPTLDTVERVLAVLNKNQNNIDNSLRLLAPFYRVFANTLGTGPWFDTYIQNLLPIPNLPNGGGVS
ncbi:MCE family protein [Nocardioides sp. TRM66260-LWL]|uniref:MCE family protein n=1 Tax=Nocardioides sp. TRM66260-LWL TaxID=2874478 RepID=UPI001CC38F0B|nr:MCE family protein [Nocardioides sp. TRM66260-LWL]MBZ5735232.1 MCE family protein [Nocardioides sp. TRM66260-LWL]